jgi:3-dehydroquinate dehydratase/shikimate dehydrogenase
MICVSILQESRRLALVDMLNAKRVADLLEVRLDRFGKAPEIGEIIAAKPKPIIMSCRRPNDGGFWGDSEADRLAILRQCIISKADYVEIEHDVADQIRPFPGSQRVVAYTNLRETPEDIADIYNDCRGKNADVVKLVTLARTPEEAWPLVKILANSSLPTVVVGLGKPGILLTLLGKKLNAPWVYAALERGMEAYPGQPTIHDLKSIYHYDAIGKGTRFIGVTGFGESEVMTVAGLNATFAHHDLPYRCLPLGVGDLAVFRKVMEATKLAACVIDPSHQAAMLEIAPHVHGAAKTSRAADLVMRKDDAWHASHVSAQAWVTAFADALKTKHETNPVLKDRIVVLVGLSGATHVLAREIHKHGGNAVIASYRRKEAGEVAKQLGCRFVQFEALYSTMHDAVVVCAEETDEQGNAKHIHPGYLKPGMCVMDLTAGTTRSKLLSEAAAKGCALVEPGELLIQILLAQARALVGKDTPREVIANALSERFRNEE